MSEEENKAVGDSLDFDLDGDFSFDSDSSEEIPVEDVYVIDPLEDLSKEFPDIGSGETDRDVASNENGDEEPGPEGKDAATVTENEAGTPQADPHIPLLPPIPGIPVKKKYNFKEPASRPNRNQMVHHKRLCRRLGIPADIADQVALLFYGTKQLLSDRMDELNLIIAFEDMMEVRPGSEIDILRLLHYRTEMGRRRVQAGLEQFQDAITASKDMSVAVKTARSPVIVPLEIQTEPECAGDAPKAKKGFSFTLRRTLARVWAVFNRRLCGAKRRTIVTSGSNAREQA